MIRNNYILAAAVSFILLCSCNGHVLKGEGPKTTTNFQVGNFQSLDIAVSVKAIINVVAGASPKVEVSGYENLIKHITTKLENNKLEINSDLGDSWILGNDKTTVLNITVASLDELSLDGATNAEIHGSLTEKEFKLDISGQGKIKIDSLNVNDFSTVVSGAGDIEINGGRVKTSNYQVSGAGKIKAFPLQSNEVVTTISGAGKAEFTALDKLTVDINGAAKVQYKGHPTLSQNVSGAGTITNVN